MTSINTGYNSVTGKNAISFLFLFLKRCNQATTHGANTDINLAEVNGFIIVINIILDFLTA